MGIVKVIAVTLAVFLHHANGRAITSTSNDNIERMLDLAAEELNTVWHETNEDPTEREENPADVLRLSEPDSSSYEAVQSQFSHHVRDESANKSSDSGILQMDVNPVWRPKRFVPEELECYTGKVETKYLTNTGLLITIRECKEVARFTACSSSMANNNNKRKCEPSNYVAYPLDNVAYPTTCSCAP